MLVVFTGLIGMLIAPGTIDLKDGVIAILAMAVGSGGAACINMWYDRDIDKLMHRTRTRSIPSGMVRAAHALYLGIALSVVSVIAMYVFINLLAASVLAFSIFFYAVVYTIWLKRHTAQNIVIGGLAGALPPLIGWVAVTNSISIEPLILVLIIFLWTPPHFWSIAILNMADYGRARIPMLPNVVGVARTKKEMLYYMIALSISTLLPVIRLDYGWKYLAAACILNAIFFWHIHKLFKSDSYAIKTFKFSIVYLFALFLAILLTAR